MNTEEIQETPEEESKEQEGNVKIPEEFQSKVTACIESATLPELDFMLSEAQAMKHKLMSSQKKNKLATDDFSTTGMPSDY